MKGHSERVPLKNLRDFNGKPLYHAVLITLLNCDKIDEVIINTDCKNITEDIVSNFRSRVTVRNRPEEIRGDYVSMNKIIEDDLNHSDGNIYLQTHSTNPLLKVESINKALDKMIGLGDKSDSIFSVTKIQTRFYDKQGKAINHNPEKLIRTQDLEPIFEENSCFYIFTKNSFNRSNRQRIGVAPEMFEIDKIESIDIDTMEDFILAEAIYKQKQNENN
ncbi:MAG: acylneuraminate cytidylyltransferase family protein [Oceanospirillaceae bacterium]|nr:acylneuraminate cytidylyltransferase family protein [Oceanospirillaceae bacterium]